MSSSKVAHSPLLENPNIPDAAHPACSGDAYRSLYAPFIEFTPPHCDYCQKAVKNGGTCGPIVLAEVEG